MPENVSHVRSGAVMIYGLISSGSAFPKQCKSSAFNKSKCPQLAIFLASVMVFFVVIVWLYMLIHPCAYKGEIHTYPEPVVFRWQSSGNPVCQELRPQCSLEYTTEEIIVGSQCASSGLPVAFQWSFSVFQWCKLTLDRHWDTTGCQHQPV